jgi:putative transposase
VNTALAAIAGGSVVKVQTSYQHYRPGLVCLLPTADIYLIVPVEDRLSRELGCIPLAIGGVPDHVHVLLRGNATLPVATIVKEVKGSSSHLANHVLTKDAFKWQGSYSAFTLRKSEAPLVKAYVEGQKQHHEVGDLWEEWEQIGTEEKESSIA